ncbi:superoxide dismutase [Bifidobacterium actinocoloniiforme DSM 22766]|uniref:Superoxide dismutase n=1 Tax=Bifidobacterium actinocoloniiforme DSM 22766 TaxID=1437605 RepID=A0A086Z130_9BIFI|nr:superoxide dismutase [Bifidobacterium actinocoloniiforme]AKV55405.1 superoxide dismutase [Bifidobacterium actinocoloniiforme DSM 22766]KFI40230.1 superoxide dismutase [Bifidobacterium actinocoloniiforme DSM 22766]
MPVYTLPDLPYDYSALEPYISGKIMELHHDKHHQAYVNGANQALEQIHDAAESGDVAQSNLLEKNLAFNLAGHKNHTIFWKNMAPANDQEPTGELKAAIEEQFGGFQGFQTYFESMCAGIQGSGWAVLAWDALGERLVTLQMYDHQGNLPVTIYPLVMLDLWEHAYYLDYQNVRADYVKAWWHIVNWQDASNRFDEVRALNTTLVK